MLTKIPGRGIAFAYVGKMGVVGLIRRVELPLTHRSCN